MAALPGQPAPKPSQLAAPVPGKEEALTADSLLADFDAPEMAAPQGEADSADNLLQGMDDPATPPPEDQFAPEPSFLQANVEQFNPENFITRLQAGLAANDTEKVGFLQKKFGESNVRMKEGNLFYRKNNGEKFKRLDPDTFELISDIIPDFAREIVTEGAMAPAEIGGAIMGSALGPGGAVAGGATGRIASMPMATSVAEGAARLAGVPQDENRDIGQEVMIGQGVEGAFPLVGGAIVKQVAKRIPGTAAYKVAKEAGEKEVIALSKQSQDVVRAAQELEQEGIKVGLTLNQVQPDDPKILRLADRVKENPQFLNKQTEFAEGYGEALRNTLTEIARRGNPNGPPAPGKLAATLTDAVATLDKVEGQEIGRFRAKAMANLKNAKQQLPAETSQLAIEAMKELGFQPKRVKLQSVTRPGSLEGVGQRGVSTNNVIERVNWTPPKNLQGIEGRLGITEGQTRAMVNVLNEYGQLVSRGNEARLSDVERLINRMGPLTQKLRGTQGGAILGKITGDLRKFRRETIGNALGDDTEKALYNRVMDDFSNLRMNAEQLQNVLRGDVTSKTIVNSFFKGKENLANIRALKSITGKNSAEWGSLKEEFINQLMVKHAGDGKTGFNSKGFLNDLEKNYGADFIREVIDDGAGPNYATVKNLLTVGKRLEQMQVGVRPEQASEAQARGIIDVAIGLAAGIKFKVINGLTALIGGTGGDEKVLFELLNQRGYEKYLANYKGPGDKRVIARNLEALMQNYNAGRAANRKVAETLDIGKDILKRGTKASIREDVMRAD